MLSALLALSLVQGIPARAWAYDTVPARLDSMVARVRRDSVVTLVGNDLGVVVLRGPRRHLADSLPVWCKSPCVWEWEEMTDAGEKVAQPASLFATWGVEAIGAPAAWAMGARGQGVIVTSLDTGIDPAHPGYTVAGGWNAPIWADTGWTDNIPGCNGHGTHVAGTMAGKNGYGVAPDAMVFGVKVFEPTPGCGSYTSNQARGVRWASQNGSRAVNISISGTPNYSLDLIVREANARGTVVCRANGNQGTTPVNGNPSEIGVASVGSSLTRSGFSNYGPTTDLAGPGEGITSTMPGGGYGGKTGTSMAAPHVCGAAALLISADPSLSADSVEALLRLSAQPLGSPTPNSYTGYGLVRPDRAIALHRGGVEVAGPKQEVVEASATVTRCHAIVAVRQWAATTNDPGVTLASTPDQLCITVDPARAPSAITVTLR